MQLLKPVPPEDIRVGMRAMVLFPPDRHCPQELMFGAGTVTFTELAGRTEVHFDSGSGGMFPHDRIYPEPADWGPVADSLRKAGWTEGYKLAGPEVPPYLWRSPDGVSGPRFRSVAPGRPPEAVLESAVKRGDIAFTHRPPG